MVAKLPIINASSYYNRPTRANFGESLLPRAECFIRTALREWAYAVAYSHVQQSCRDAFIDTTGTGRRTVA